MSDTEEKGKGGKTYEERLKAIRAEPHLQAR